MAQDRILMFGRTGQVARAVLALRPDVMALGRGEADLTDPHACAALIAAHRPAAVINAAAFTGVDAAESCEDAATVINAHAPGLMARACAAQDIAFIHISSDYVFDGSGERPFAPDHPVAPLGAYGRSKAAGEAAVIAAGGRHVILRTSWVFAPEGKNFVTAMLRLGRERDHIGVVADQIGGPTPASAIARACLHCADVLQTRPDLGGIHHFSGAPDLSWADFARAIFACAGLPCRVDNIPSTAYPTAAKRPLNSRLECAGLVRLGLTRPDWREEMRGICSKLE